jgi:hypothetical protein
MYCLFGNNIYFFQFDLVSRIPLDVRQVEDHCTIGCKVKGKVEVVPVLNYVSTTP